MDHQRFDKLAKGLSQSLSRRSAWQRMLGGVLGLVGIAASTVEAEAQSQNKRFRGQHCLPNQQVCRPANPNANTRRRTNHRHPCRECCSGYSVRVGQGRKCSCRPLGMKAKNRTQCCSGVRRNGRCVEKPSSTPPPPAQCLSFAIEGTAARVPGGFTLESDCATGTFGVLDANIPRNAFTFGDITRLQATFAFAEGTCESGSPRFSLVAANQNTVFVDLGPDANPATCPAPPGTAQNTGNMIDPTSTAKRFIVNGVARTYLEALAALEGRVLTDILFVADSSHCASPADGRQVLSVDPCVNVRP